MAKRFVKVIITAEYETDNTWYNDTGDEVSDKIIKKLELDNYQEWILENVISEEIIVSKKKL